MLYLRGKREKRFGFGYRTLVLVAVFILVFYVWGEVLFGGLGRVTAAIFHPLTRSADPARNIFFDLASFWKFQKTLVADNRRLEDRIRELEVELAENGELKSENEELKSVLKMGEDFDGARPIKVLSRPGLGFYDMLLLDLGGNKVNVGNLVFSGKDVVLGQIAEVNGRTAKAKLYSSGGEEMPVTVGASGISAIATGRGGGNLSVTLPRGLEIKEGDTVRTTLIGDHLLGIVGRIDKDPNNPFQKVLLKSPVNVYEIKWVYVKQ